MAIVIRPSDLYYRYSRRRGANAVAPDPDAPFDRDDLDQLLPLFAEVMDALGTDDGRVLQRIEEFLIYNIPRSISRRAEIADCLIGSLRQELGPLR